MKSPKIRFKGYIDAWEQRKFKETFNMLQNNTVSRADLNYENGTAKNLHYGDVLIKFGDYIDASCTELPFFNDELIVQRYNGSFLQDGDIVIVDTAEDTSVGKCTEIQGSEGMILLSGLHTIPCRPKKKYAPKFMGYYINSFSYHDQLMPLMQGTKVTSISKCALQETKLLMPKSVDEQEKIGSCFSYIDTFIHLHQRKCEGTKKLKKYMLQKMFPQNGMNVPEIRFEGFTGDWDQRKLSDYLVVSTQKNRNEIYNKEDVLSVSGDFGIVNQIKFQGRSFAGESVANYGVVETGDIVYTKSPLKSNPYGIIKTNKGNTGIVSTLYAVYKPSKSIDSCFIQIYFEQNARMNNYMQPLVNKGAKNDMKVSAENALKGDVIFPGIDEQHRIVEYFEKLDNLITLYQQKCDELNNIKKFMLRNMFV